MNLPNKKYKIIYDDPPWDYWMGKEKGKWLQGVANKHYNTMSNDDICNLPISQLADDDCILFIWATFPKIMECLEVIKAWGFVYKTIGFSWIKTAKSGRIRRDGIGWYTTSNLEVCLIAKKGNIHRNKTGISQIVLHPRTKHSRKPDEVREKIVKLMGNLPRIELFARTKIEGWDAWGNEVPKEEQKILKCHKT